MFSIRVLSPILRHPHIHTRYMSVRPSASTSKTTIARLAELRASGTPISVLTAYDFPTARACSAHPVDITLVGDSLAQVCLGYASTTQLTLDEIIHHCRAVARGTTTPLLVSDMPFGTYAPGPTDAVRAAVRIIQEGHAEAVKLEGGLELIPHVTALTQIGIPVMAHIGLLPQRATALSGYRVQGRTAASAETLLRTALALEKAGAFAMVLEAMPSQLGEYITRSVKIPTIGIGAGPKTSGQVLVFDDMLGTWHGHKAKFVRHFADVQKEIARGISGYVQAVKDGSFPDPEREGYSINAKEWEAFLHIQSQQAQLGTSTKSSPGHVERQRPSGPDSAPQRGDNIMTGNVQVDESRTNALAGTNETDEKAGKKLGLHAL